MDLDPEGIFRDDSDSDSDLLHQRESTKEFSVYLVDASPKMFRAVGTTEEDEKEETFFHAAVQCISESLKAQIIGRSSDEISICFFNTREKKNIQDLHGVFVFNVAERELLDRPTARLIKEFSSIEDSFMHHIGSRYWIEPASRENPLYNALWVAQALLRKGSLKNVSMRILIFTNEDNPFGNIYGSVKADMIRTTLQRAKDAQELGISMELLPLGGKEFDVSILYANLLGLESEEMPLFLSSADEKLEDMANQLRKRIFSKRKVKTIMFKIASGVSVQVNAYALIRPSTPGPIMWLDSVTSRPLKTERTFICADTGALVQQPRRGFPVFNGEIVKFTVEELAEIKKVSDGHLHLLGFKPLGCLKGYHNMRPSTFIYPTDEEIVGSTLAFVALHRSMLRLQRFGVAFYGSSSHPQLVALVAQDEIISSSGQLEPPGMHMIYLPYSDDIRYPEELLIHAGGAPRATDDQIKKASALLKRIDLKDFSVCQFSNPALQRHYGVLQALAMGEDEVPNVKDETLPDEEGMRRPGVLRVIEEFKVAVYGENHDQEEAAKNDSITEASKKRKAIYEVALKESASYDWADLAENGKLKDLTVIELKSYLTVHNLPVAGKKEVLISRILTHLGL
ncbi:ATP-dependent DNA helicase 2 subunit KU70 isoform X2 [Phalaenopsis equestris]|uniref:ATP-dependent DNA helicase 2 subunit KU70 isoform X2 n=1 Tax=Phalaenopsis equestris TaxID=78828 RepID=UPI0009E5AE03|nr:ATP-dependent DNA helicase 2 subunit KU70 isoform X2 [Phalaenopsis equestris]